MKSFNYYNDTLSKIIKKILKKLTAYDTLAIQFFYFAIGLIVAALFPKFSKRFRMLFFMFGFFALLPVIIKSCKTIRQVI